MKIHVTLGYANVDGSPLHELLQLPEKHMEIEASTTREVFDYLRAASSVARERFALQFDSNGVSGGWITILNYRGVEAKAIKSDADLDLPLKEGDRIYITNVTHALGDDRRPTKGSV